MSDVPEKPKAGPDPAVPDLEGNLLDQMLESATLVTLRQQVPEVLRVFRQYAVGTDFITLFAQQRGSFFNGLLPPAWRRGTLRVLDGQGSVWLYLRQLPSLAVRQTEVLDENSLGMALIRKEAPWPYRRYGVFNAAGDRVGALLGTRWWSTAFSLHYAGERVGELERQAGDFGSGQLALHHFVLSWQNDLPLDVKKVLLGGALLLLWHHAPPIRRRQGLRWRD